MAVQPIPEKFGTILGFAPGNVPAYSCDYDSADAEEYPTRHSYRSYCDDIYMGYRWQCVEFARRWLYINHGYVFDDVSMAYEIFHLRNVTRCESGEELPLHSFANGSKRPPEPGALLIWREGGEFAHTGHVAVITEVFPDRVRVAEQNVDHHRWPEGCNYARELEARQTEKGHYWLRCSMHGSEIIGWVIQTSDSRHAEPLVELDPGLMTLELQTLSTEPDPDRAWLNEANPAEAAYVKAIGGHYLAVDPNLQSRFLEISETLEGLLKRMTAEVHALFLHATDYVMQDESRLEPFNLPRSLWPKIAASWNDRRHEMITGRLDFSVTSEGIKVYEYNCDSASCHMEASIVQGKWAEYAHCQAGRDGGAILYDLLVHAWKSCDADGTIHILHDRDPEETYHALFMKELMEASGLSCKVLDCLDGLKWGDQQEILDPDGSPIRWVWKTWAWETALDQLREECEQDERRLSEYRYDTRKEFSPRLVDTLLRKDVMVYEPLWTLIPSNKAILPILWQLFPGHPMVLESHYDLTPSLQKRGYVEKPIVGRCGDNISLVGHDSRTLKETEGSFAERSRIFQELFPLPLIQDYHVQVSSFTVNGGYAGSCARLDTSPIIRSESDLVALRVVR